MTMRERTPQQAAEHSAVASNTISGDAVQTGSKAGVVIHERLVKRLLMAAVALVMIVHLLTLTTYPPVFIDEGWLANASWTWLKTGVNFDSIHTGTLDQLDNPWVWRQFLGEAPFVLSYAVFGVSLFQTRLVAWVFGSILLYATTRVGRRLYGPITGWLAALMLALSFAFLLASRWRQDIMLAALIMLAFWLLLVAVQDNKLWAHFAAALLLTLGLDVQQNALMFIPAWAILYVVFYGKRVFIERGTWLAAAGGALGITIYVALHILPAPETYSQLMSFWSGTSHRLPILEPASLLRSLADEMRRYFRLSNLEEFIVVASGCLFLALRRRREDYVGLVFLVTVVATFTLFSGHKWDLYAILLFPFMFIVAAETIVDLLRRRSGGGTSWMYARILAGIMLVVFLVVKVVEFGQTIHTHRAYDYDTVTAQLRAPIPDDAIVMGIPQWWFGFSDMDYRSTYSLPFLRFFNGHNTEAALRVIRPDYIIMDYEWRFLLLDDPNENPLVGNLWIPRQEFLDIMEARGTLILEVDYDWEGDVLQLYKMDWS